MQVAVLLKNTLQATAEMLKSTSASIVSLVLDDGLLFLQAYQVLKHGGVNEDNIIVMVQDDLAGNYMNPHPGKVFNKPNGPDVYEGVTLVRNHLWSGAILDCTCTPRLMHALTICNQACLMHVQDYTGEAVNARNFLQILAGKKVGGHSLGTYVPSRSCAH